MWIFSFLIGPLLIQYLWVYFYFFIMSEDILEIEQKPTKNAVSKELSFKSKVEIKTFKSKVEFKTKKN